MSMALLPFLPVLGGILAGAAAVLTVLFATSRLRPGLRAAGDVVSRPRVFRFRNGYLLDHSGNVGFLLPDPVNRLTAWNDLQAALRPIVPGCAAAFRSLSDAGCAFTADGTFGHDRLRLVGHREGADLCISILAGAAAESSVCIERSSLAALETERAFLAGAADTSPALSWRTDQDGAVIWANDAYRTVVARCFGADAARGWPMRVLFPDDTRTTSRQSRRRCTDPDGGEHWFDVTLAPPGTDGTRQGNALSLDALMIAEKARRGFIQTLARGFAELPAGLAIFGADSRLLSFNPALIDMSGLDAGWLSRRPLLEEVFSQLRTGQNIPVPRDFAAWRAKLTDKTDTATVHSEIWPTPDGTTLRLLARPQPNGAVTLLIEDISDAVTAEDRRTRQTETVASLLEATEQGFVLFDAAGMRGLANQEAQRIWVTGRSQLPDTLQSCLAFWRTLCRPSPLWGEIRDVAAAPATTRAAWDEKIITQNGVALHVRVLPLPDGGLALVFAGPDSFIPALPRPIKQHALTG